MWNRLSVLGWSPFFEAKWQEGETLALEPARVAAEHRGEYEVWTASGPREARLAGRLRHALGEGALPGVGDWVGLDGALVQRVLERRTVFQRGAAGREARPQVVAANVDVVLVVSGLDADFNLRRIERYLARVLASGASPLVVLSKADVADDAAARVRLVESRAPSVEVVAISAVRGEGLSALRARLTPGTTAALVGSSGAGKTTLVNALLGEDRLAVGAVREGDGRGRHTTTHRQLVRLPEGGLVLDTPGMRELRLLDEAGLDRAFDDVAVLVASCRFTDCQHAGEPGCAVRAELDAGGARADRVAHYLELSSEARAYERRRDARLRREDERAGASLTREGRRRSREKGGG
jgi:ribosome biogenesis GTPase